MKLSVGMVTYNHEAFIAQAIQSVVGQTVDCDYELLVSDDCSTDHTFEIVQDYARKFPGIVKPLIHSGNIGALENFISTVQACRGEYTALLDGDDYWTSPRKIQTQIDFMDSHPEYSLSFHNAERFFEDTREKGPVAVPKIIKPSYSIVDFLKTNPVHSSTLMWRRSALGDLPQWVHTVPNGDWAVNILCLEHGDAGYIGETMSLHRYHSGGVWTSRPEIKRWEGFVDFYEVLKGHFGSKYEGILRQARCEACCRLALLYARDKDTPNAVRYVRRCLRERRSANDLPTYDLVRMILNTYTPRTCMALRALKGIITHSWSRIVRSR